MYWSHFGMDRQPFRAAVDPDSYFPGPTHEDALAAVAASYSRRDPAVLLDGPTGVGKSLVARKWLDRLSVTSPRVFVPNAHAERPAALLQAMLFDMGKPYQGLTEAELRLAATGALLDLVAERGEPIVLFLDEAQHLGQSALEELRLLTNLETHAGPAVFALLAAQPSLRDALRRPAHELFAQRLTMAGPIMPLTAPEAVDYLRSQIKQAGGRPDELLDAAAASLLAAAGEGIPRVLNRAAALSFELAAAGGAEQVDVEAALEAVERLGLTVVEPEDVVLLPHPARTAEPEPSTRGKSPDGAAADEEPAARGPKERASRKKSV